MDIVIRIITLLASFFAVMVVLSFHEFAHAFVAYKCGDPTAKINGRCSLNPMVHFDLLGLIMFTFAGFGWAKPVPVNPNNFKKYRSGCFWTSAAGIITNYISAFLFAPLFLLATKYLAGNTYGYLFIRDLTYLLFAYSLSFCIFNLLPFYPLDGFRIVDALNRKRGKVYWFLRKYGYYILLGLIGISFLSRYIPFLGYINILGYVMEFAVNIFGWPIDKFWGLIIR